MSKTSFIDFKAVKAALRIEQVLEHYGLLDKFKRSGDTLSGPCPIHNGSNPTQFRISLSKNLWNCFSECKKGGNVLDFIAKMEDASIHAAAMKAIEWFGLDLNAITTRSDGDKNVRVETSPATNGNHATAASEKPRADADQGTPNKPLKFRLEKLERTHPYLTERGLTLETIDEFGVGYCSKGMMAQRIAIPIQNPDGNVVAYAGRFPGEAPADTPKYKLPPGFRKSLELYNIERALKAPIEIPLVIVEGFFDCMKLHQLGCHKVVALMGSSMLEAQEKLLCERKSHWTQILLMLDEDEAGQSARDDIAPRLAKFSFVKIHVFTTDAKQPDALSADEARNLFGGAP